MLIGRLNTSKEGEDPPTQGDSPGSKAGWPAPLAEAPLSAILALPGSKSLTNRELILAALANGPGRLIRPLHSRDSQLMIDGLRAMGVQIEEVAGHGIYGSDVRITPADELIGSTTIACGLAGTVMRFLPAVAALALGPVAFDGDPYARKRPMRPVLDALRALGADIADEGRGALPFTVHGTGSLRGGRVEVDASLSSQFVSALLLAAPHFDEGVHVVHTGERLPSVPHIEMTLAALRARGVEADSPATGEWRVAPGPIEARDITLEPDLSNAAPFFAAALAAGGSVSVTDWPAETTQVGKLLPELLETFGATAHTAAPETGDTENGAGAASRTDAALRTGSSTLTVEMNGPLRGVKLHIPEAGELAPTLVGLAALAAHGNGTGDGEPSEITGIGHIRQHETDRIAALVTEINRLGGRAEELPDGIAIHPAILHGETWHSYEDHRMATTGAVIGLRIPDVIVDDIETTAKTLPQFPELWARMLGREPELHATEAALVSGGDEQAERFDSASSDALAAFIAGGIGANLPGNQSGASLHDEEE